MKVTFLPKKRSRFFNLQQGTCSTSTSRHDGGLLLDLTTHLLLATENNFGTEYNVQSNTVNYWTTENRRMWSLREENTQKKLHAPLRFCMEDLTRRQCRKVKTRFCSSKVAGVGVYGVRYQKGGNYPEWEVPEVLMRFPLRLSSESQFMPSQARLLRLSRVWCWLETPDVVQCWEMPDFWPSHGE